MTHPLVTQLRFARTEFIRCLEGVTDAEARQRIGPMNCISWIIGHLAAQEHYLWVVSGQGQPVAQDLEALVGFGRPASTPPLDDMWARWRQIMAAADIYLDTLTPELVQTNFVANGKRERENIGTKVLRNTFHYWFHLGEAHAIRQQLGHQDLPQFVGNLSSVRF